MDFERLGEPLISDSVEDNDNYVKVGTEESQPVERFDFVKAKAFLSTTNQRLNISLYDHMADVIKAILRSQIPDAVDKLEDISCEVKKMRQKPESDLTEVCTISEELKAFIEEKKVFYKFKEPVPEADEVTKTIDDDEEEEESDEEEEEEEEKEAVAGVDSSESVEELDLSGALPDISCIMSRFNEAGIGLSPMEVFELAVALKDLAVEFKLKKVRFWGKMFGIKNDYYVAEAPYQEGIVQENYGWKSSKPSKTETEEAEEEKEKDEDEEDEEDDKVEEEKEEDDDKEGEEEEEQEEAVKIPPIPESKQETKKKIPSEKNGTGVNEFVYFVCTKLGQPWRVLPFMLPSHISEARYLKRFFAGDLELTTGTQSGAYSVLTVIGIPNRPSPCTSLSSEERCETIRHGCNIGEKDEDEEEEDEDEEKDENEIVLNSKFEPKKAKDLLSEGLAEWCHYRKAILYQGRCIPMKIGEKDDDEEEKEEPEKEEEDEDETKEEEEPEILEAIAETQVPILRSLSEDKAIGRLKPWTMRLSSKLVEEKAILIVHCNIWPGAYTFYDGKNFEHIYIGYGMKFSVFHHAPAIRVHFQPEYQVGEDLIEDVNVEVLPKEETEEGDEGDEKEEKEVKKEDEEEGEKEEEEGDEEEEEDED